MGLCCVVERSDGRKGMGGRGCCWGGGPIFALLDGDGRAENGRLLGLTMEVVVQGRVWGRRGLGIGVRGVDRVGYVMVEKALEIIEGPVPGRVGVEHGGGFATKAKPGRL
jgi:hypothetical protein